MCRFVEAAIDAASRTNGLVDPTLLGEIETAGYRTDLSAPLPIDLALRLAPIRRAAKPHPAPRWTQISVDSRRRIVKRPRGVELDSGGIAKGLFADLAAERLAGFDAWAVDVCGDIRIGGRAALPRRVRVDDPFRRGAIEELRVTDGAVATSGISRRSWLGRDGRVAHHLLDPSHGPPRVHGHRAGDRARPDRRRGGGARQGGRPPGPGRRAPLAPARRRHRLRRRLARRDRAVARGRGIGWRHDHRPHARTCSGSRAAPRAQPRSCSRASACSPAS